MSMSSRRGVAVFASFGALVLVVAGYWVGCGGNGSISTTFQGNISSVTPAPMAQAPAQRSFVASLESLVSSKAVAVSCPAQNVLACAEALSAAAPSPTVTNTPPTPVPTPTGPTPTPRPTSTSGPSCSQVNSESCEFSTEFRLADDRRVNFFFVEDENKNKAPDNSEPEAVLDNEELKKVCAGDLVTLTDVGVNFANGTAHAAKVTKDVDACTPTPQPTPTRTATRPTPTATATGPTPTATATPTSTPTGPTPTATQTATPCPACGSTAHCCGTCVAASTCVGG